LEDIGFWFADKGFTLTIVAWPAGRSENFPVSLTPKLMKLDTEEIFVFEFDSVDKALDALGENTEIDKTVYIKDAFVLIYPGANQTIIDVLKAHFAEADWKK
jgi:hypothetical protein